MTGPPVPLAWAEGRRALRMLDQTRLPADEVYLELGDVEAVAEAIVSLRVRGAPAIGIAAAMGLALGLANEARESGSAGTSGSAPGSVTGFVSRTAFDAAETLLLSTRPTGRNLAWALRRMRSAFDRSEGALQALFDEADAILEEDGTLCRRIGQHGLLLIPDEGGRVLTHCNAGALATGGLGTALAPVYLAHERGIPVSVWASETRPVLQGARLTAWELARAGVDVTVVTDSMVGALMAEGRVDLVFVGADAVTANGDVVNKIGTYAVAVLASHHGIPFYVAAPRTTLDPSTPTGRDVPIEQRDDREVRHVGGLESVDARAAVWNPAFDVTPADLVTAIVTDGGVLRPPYGPHIGQLADPHHREKGEELP